MLVLRQGNLALRFLLELVLLAAIATATARLVGQPVLGVAAGAVVVIAVSTVWALVVHGPSVPAPVRAATQVAALVLGTLATAHLGGAWTAASVAATAVLNATLLSVWHQ